LFPKGFLQFEEVKTEIPETQDKEILEIKQMMQNFSNSMSMKKISILKEPNTLIILLKSPFIGRSPTIFFQYPNYCE
jgi:hypothetical protein